MLRSIIGNLKYPKGRGGLGGHGGPNPPPLGSNDYLAKILSTSLGIFVCMLTRSVPLGICGLDLMLVMVWASIVVNGALIIVIIK
jgi:hypothetical protein